MANTGNTLIFKNDKTFALDGEVSIGILISIDDPYTKETQMQSLRFYMSLSMEKCFADESGLF